MTYYTESAHMHILTFKAASAIGKGCAVKADTSNLEPYVAIAGDGETAIGLTLEAATAVGQPIKVCLGGVCIGKANAAITYGESVNSAAATGKIDTAGAAEHALGYALGTATAQDDEIPVLISHHVTAAG